MDGSAARSDDFIPLRLVLHGIHVCDAGVRQLTQALLEMAENLGLATGGSALEDV
jgi:hypothetical protein